MQFAPKRKSYTRKAIIYGIFAALCLIKITQFYIFFFIFAGLCAFYVYQANKHKDDKGSPLYNYYMKKRNTRKEQKRAEKERNEALSKRELKERYKNRMEQIEAEYAFLDEDDVEYVDESEDIE